MTRTFEVGHGLTCDVDRLVASRLLIQANSGGGKTRTLRRLLEQTHGKVQHLVIDPEGEYHTLREKFDYVLASPKGGDTVAHPRTAKLLAERLLQLGVSAILDIYELNPDERQRFVKMFLQALVDAPRDLWHPALVVLDEAHVYAPEGKESESTAAVKAMASRGRKRGFCLVPATQRLAKLSKDVAAECNNKLIGRCTLDVDIKRAAEELGFSTNEQKQGLRQLEPGQFYAYGPAFGVAAPQIVKVGGIKTTHPEPGQQPAPVPPPTEKVRKVLQQLADLPAEADAREKSLADLKKENADLRRQVAQATKATKPDAAPVLSTKVVEKKVIGPKEVGRLEGILKRLEVLVENFEPAILAARAIGATAADLLVDIQKTAGDVRQLLAPVPAPPLPRVASAGYKTTTQGHAPAPRAPRQPPEIAAGNGDLSGPERKILGALAELEALGRHPADKQQLGLMAGYTNVRSGGFSEPLGRLTAGGYVTSPRTGQVAMTDTGRALIGEVDPPQTSDELQQRIMGNLTGPEQKLLRALLSAYPEPVTKEDLGAACGYTNIRSGGFSEPLGRLNTLGLARSPERGVVVAAPALFLEG